MAPRGLTPRQAGTNRTPRRCPQGCSPGKSRRPSDAPDGQECPSPHDLCRPPKKSASKSTYMPTAPGRVQEILQRLDKLYPDVTCALHHHSAWELLVATILSAQSTDVRVNMVTPELFRKYPTVQDFAALTPEQLQPDVRSTGFFRNKSKSVVGAAKKIVSDFGGQVPDQMDELLTLPGVARKTANVVLGTWFKTKRGRGRGYARPPHQPPPRTHA